MLRDQEVIQAAELGGISDPAAKGRLARAKMSAGDLIPAYRAVLFPEDDDG